MARILLVEDDPVSSKLVTNLLERHGHEVAHVGNGLEAIDRLAVEEFDLLVTDLMMGRLDGRGLCEWVRGEPSIRTLPILLTTGRLDCAGEPWVDEQQVEVLEKPIKLRHLLERVAYHTRRTSG